ncbi:hypothetical protein GCM10009638_25660 [Luteococcus sanguinis]
MVDKREQVQAAPLTPGYLLGRPPTPWPVNHNAWFSAGMNQDKTIPDAGLEDVTHVVMNYVPRYVDLHDWLVVREFVQRAVLDSQPISGDEARRRITIVGMMVAWAHRLAGYDLDRTAIFTLDVIGEWIDQECGHYSLKVRKMYRARLKSISKTINPEFPDVPNETAYQSAWNPDPYSAEELAEVVGWANGQSTAMRRHKALVLLALTVGAGLYTQEVAALKVSDIEVDDDGVLLHVRGEHPREVPVLAEWEGVLRELVANVRPVDPEAFAFASGRTNKKPNVVTRFVQSSNKGGKVEPMTRRMRATWVVEHIKAGVPPQVIAEAAGMVTLRSFDKWLYHYREFETEEYRCLLRDEMREQKRLSVANKRARKAQRESLRVVDEER